MPLLLRQPVAIFANDIRELGFHVLDLMGRETVWIGSLSVQLMGDGERRSWREYGGGGNSCLLAEFASGDAMGAVFWRLASRGGMVLHTVSTRQPKHSNNQIRVGLGLYTLI